MKQYTNESLQGSARDYTFMTSSYLLNLNNRFVVFFADKGGRGGGSENLHFSADFINVCPLGDGFYALTFYCMELVSLFYLRLGKV